MRPSGRGQLLRSLALTDSLRTTPARLPKGSATPLLLVSHTHPSASSHRNSLSSLSSKRYYSRDPLQAEHEANTVRGNRAARSRIEEQARQQQGNNQKGEDQSYKRKYGSTKHELGGRDRSPR